MFCNNPEKEFEINNLADRLRKGKSMSKSSSVVIVAEGIIMDLPIKLLMI